MNTPFVRDEHDIMAILHQEIDTCSYLMIADEQGVFDELLIQPLDRTVYGCHKRFLGIRNIVYKEQYRGQRRFSMLLTHLEALGVPIMVHDIINPRLMDALITRGYSLFIDDRRDETITSCYFIPQSA